MRVAPAASLAFLHLTHPNLLMRLHRRVLGKQPRLAVGETVTLLYPPLPSAGVSMGMQKGRQQNDSLADG